jgi:hypothetical protein
MTTIMPLWPSGNYNRGPISQIQPFTYQDDVTYLDILYLLRDYIRNQVVPQLNHLSDEVDAAIDDMLAAVQKAIDDQTASVDAKIAQLDARVDTKIADLVTLVNGKVADLTTFVNTSIADLTTYVDEQVQLIIDDSIEVQDPVVAGMFGDPVTQTRVAADAVYSAMIYRKGSRINVADYGAVGNGVANDTTAIANAITAASAGGGSVYFRPGTYLSEPLTIPANVTLFGDSAATIKARSASGILISITGGNSGLNGMIVDGANIITSYLVDIARSCKGVSFKDSELKNITGTGTIALIRARADDDNLTINNCWIHHSTSTTIGRGVLVGDTVNSIQGVKIYNSIIEDIYPVADADGICIQDFPNMVDVAILNVTFRRNAKRGIKIQCDGVRVSNCDINIGTTGTPAFCGIAIYASNATVTDNRILGVYATAFIDVGAGTVNIKNVQCVNNSIVGDPATRQASCDGIRAEGASIRNSVFNNQIYCVRNGYHFEYDISNVSIAGIIDDALASAVILNDHLGVNPPRNVVIPWLVVSNIINYGIHTNGGNAPTNVILGPISGVPNFGKLGGNIAAGIKTGFFDKNPIVKPIVTGTNTGDGAMNSLMARLGDLGLIIDNRT